MLDRPDVARPAAVADLLNRLFPFDSATEQFATLMYGVLDAAAGEFRYVSAGHPGPVHLPARGAPALLETPGFPVGLSDEPYAECCLRLAPGDRLYLDSDGLPDTLNPAGDRFCEARLLAAVGRARAATLDDGIVALLDEITGWLVARRVVRLRRFVRQAIGRRQRNRRPATPARGGRGAEHLRGTDSSVTVRELAEWTPPAREAVLQRVALPPPPW